MPKRRDDLDQSETPGSETPSTSSNKNATSNYSKDAMANMRARDDHDTGPNSSEVKSNNIEKKTLGSRVDELVSKFNNLQSSDRVSSPPSTPINKRRSNSKGYSR